MKIFDENSIEKLNFIIIFGKFVTKNRAFGNNTSFLQQFFRLRGGDFSPLPPPPPLNPPMLFTRRLISHGIRGLLHFSNRHFYLYLHREVSASPGDGKQIAASDEVDSGLLQSAATQGSYGDLNSNWCITAHSTPVKVRNSYLNWTLWKEN